MSIRLFQPETTTREEGAPPPDRVIRGAPKLITENAYESPSGQTFIGQWSASVGAWRVAYTEFEYCRILSGRARITSADGHMVEVGPGDRFVIEPGFRGVWEVLEPMTKDYVICLPGAP